MSLRRTADLVLATAIAACLMCLQAVPATAVPSQEQTSADRAALDHAIEQYEAAQAASAEIDARVSAASAGLDQAVADEAQCQERLRARVVAMYRSSDTGTLELLMSAETIQDLAVRLDLLDRIARRDAENLRALKAARAEATRSAEELLGLQAESAQALDALAVEVASAREQLAASEAALREYEAKMAAAAAARAAAAKAAAAAEAAKNTPSQQLTGSGEWQTAVASHYALNFTGRSASGEQIGPYSMIVAHKTLPFGTLIEFEYNGKRAVAKVADRGPFVAGREFDLGPGVIRVLGFSGVHEVRYRIISQ